jgi:hypothetical protein
MAKYIMLALNGPTEGQEEAYNDWYSDTHVPELLNIPGIVSARRFKTVQSNLQWPYVAAYEIETDDLQTVMANMQAGLSPFPVFFDRSKSAHLLAIALDED